MCTMSKRFAITVFRGICARARLAILKGGYLMDLGKAKAPGLGGQPWRFGRGLEHFSELVVVWPLPATETKKGLATTVLDQCSVEMRLYWSRDRRRSTNGAAAYFSIYLA